MDTENDNGNSANDEANEFAGRSIAEIRLAAEQGNFRASHILGTLYYEGKGVEKDKTESTRWWQLADQQQHDANVIAAEEGDAEAQYDLGMEYVWGSWATNENSEEYNEQEARKWFRLAAEQRHAAAQYELGMLYSHGGWILPGDPAECFKWVRRAAEQGDAEASRRLGYMFLDGSDGAPQDFPQAVKYFRTGAELGDGFCMRELGRIYASGRPGVSQDDEEAANWYSRLIDSDFYFHELDSDLEGLKRHQLLAARGHSESQYDLGMRYEEGRGVKQNFPQATKWYELSADQGNALAQFRLGLMYAEGKGVPQDDGRAVGLYMLAAEQGVAAAQNNLGVMYDVGRGIKQDSRKAAKWFRLSAKQGDETAQYNLGLMYQDGSGVSKNGDKAAKWYRLAARQSYPWASLALGLLRQNLDDLKDAAKGLFNLHHAEEYLPLGETHIQMERFKGQLADLIAEKGKEQAKAIQRSGSAEALAGLHKTFIREMLEETGLRHQDHYDFRLWRSLKSYREVEGSRNNHAYTEYLILVFEVVLTDSGQVTLFDQLSAYPDRLTWFTVDDLIRKTTVDGKAAYIDALHADLGDNLRGALCGVHEAFADRLLYREETDALDIPFSSEIPLLRGRTGKERLVGITLADQDCAALWGLAWHMKQLPFAIVKNARLLPSGWIKILDEGLANRVRDMATSLMGAGFALIESRYQVYFRLSAAPTLIFFYGGCFRYDCGSTETNGGLDCWFRLCLDPKDTPFGRIAGVDHKFAVTRNTQRIIKSIECGQDPEGDSKIKGGDVQRLIREQIDARTKPLGLRKFVRVEDKEYFIALDRM